jgi:vacuolar-type H+-ATPase subunit H
MNIAKDEADNTIRVAKLEAARIIEEAQDRKVRFGQIVCQYKLFSQ